MAITTLPKEERRRYKRLDTIFPVEFQVLDKELHPLSNWYQSFSQDISKYGICLTINSLSKEDFLKFEFEKADLLLQIHSPLSEKSFLAYAKVAWTKKLQELPHPQFITGLKFTKVDESLINKLIDYVRIKQFLWHTLQFLIFAMLLYLGLVATNNLRLQSHNIALLGKYSSLLKKDLDLSQNYEILTEEKQRLNKELSDSKLEMEILKETMRKVQDSKKLDIDSIEKKLVEARGAKIETDSDAARFEELKRKLDQLKNTKEEETKKLQQEIAALKDNEKRLKNKLAEIAAKESEIKEESSVAKEEEKFVAEKLNNQLYNWIKSHQNQRTGLIVSYEGDYYFKDTSFTYDQALAVIAYILLGDVDKAKKGLDFFLNKAQRLKTGGFYNAYYANRGEVSEYIAHVGPNLWLGIAILQYTKKTADYTYINLAKQIADWIQLFQDKEGGIVGGENINWYSTEHNLDAFAFFNMLYESTNEKKYKDIADSTLKWLIKYSFGNENVPINRGKGDSTIATDTYAWSIAALGPELLKKSNLDPDKILKFAIENCLITDDFIDRSGKTISVSGFDFSKYEHMSRAKGGVISCEWTAQMILAFDIMADYYLLEGDLKNSTYYRNQTTKYLNDLNKMIITSPSALGRGEWCLPYASQENVDTGHGWRTPKGDRTGSVAATAYTIFAISKFNPLKLP